MERRACSMIRNKRLIGLLTCIIILMAGFLYSIHLQKEDYERNSIQNGVLDLHSWNLEERGILDLSGEWNFYWRKLLSYEDAASLNLKPTLSAEVPNSWNSYRVEGKSLPGCGYATYVLKVINATPGETLALKIPTFSTSYKLYIDKTLVSSNGIVSTIKKQASPEYQPKLIEFSPHNTSFLIIVQVSNYTYSRGGMWYTINMGTPSRVKSLDTAITFKDLFLFGALSVLAFYYLSLFLLRREDKSSLYFVFMCFILTFRTIDGDNYLIRIFIPSISFHAIMVLEYLTLALFPVCAAYMISELFPEESSRKILKISLAYTVGVIVMLVLTPILFFTKMIYFLEVMAILIASYPVFILCKAFIKGRKDSFIMLIGALVVILFGIRDMLYQNNIIESNIGELVSFGLFILLLFQSFVLSRRFSAAFKEVRSLSQKLMSMDKIKDEFLANTSHELRTPLSAIIGITEAMIKGSEGDLNQKQKKNLSIIAGSSRRLTNLVNDILDYSKMKNGDIILNLRSLQIEGLVETVANIFKQLNTTKEYDIITEVQDGLSLVIADENRIVQILFNLIGNAAKFTVKGQIKITARGIGEYIEICVKDTGEGIPKDKQEDIFKSFEQVDTSLTRRHGGTGLGLAITKRLVELQGGEIWVESQPGEGSSFYFTIPVSKDTANDNELNISMPEAVVSEQEYIEEDTEEDKESLENVRLLLVDDDMVNLQAAKSILKLGRYGITTAGSGKRALEELERYPKYSLVILDVMMPEMSGYEVCKKIREYKSVFELPILMLTAKTSAEDIVMGLEVGANDYLPKPFEPEELLARVKTLVNLKLSVDNAMASEIAFMQAQIKPHFLYNTLNAIASFCDTNPARAQQLIGDFSDYLRQSFDFKSIEMFVPLERELSLVKSYVAIEKARFGDKFEVELHIDVTLDSKIPFLSLQPLIENAINHGVRKKRGKGIVRVSIQPVLEELMVIVEDDGQGIPEDKLEVLLDADNGHGIGLWNIDRRLKKICGKGLSITSTYGKGTKISYTIPLEVK